MEHPKKKAAERLTEVLPPTRCTLKHIACLKAKAKRAELSQGAWLRREIEKEENPAGPAMAHFHMTRQFMLIADAMLEDLKISGYPPNEALKYEAIILAYVDRQIHGSPYSG